MKKLLLILFFASCKTITTKTVDAGLNSDTGLYFDSNSVIEIDSNCIIINGDTTFICPHRRYVVHGMSN